MLAGLPGMGSGIMDRRLVVWARAVKSRRARRRLPDIPVLWLFTDPVRTPDLRRIIAALPAGLCGVVFRHDGASGRVALAHAVARACRARRVALTVAGDLRLAAQVKSGVHLRAGWWPGRSRPAHRLRTSSAHGAADILRARRAGAGAIFLSPAYATRSHAGVHGLGPLRWAALAHPGRDSVLALGGVRGCNAARLPRWCAGAGAIDAFNDGGHGRIPSDASVNGPSMWP